MAFFCDWCYQCLWPLQQHAHMQTRTTNIHLTVLHVTHKYARKHNCNVYAYTGTTLNHSEYYALHICTHTHSMSRLGMNTYLYAPKDDDKHRACWRDLYSLEEADQLAQLIREAQNRGISFIYAIAPGLDITFSNNRDVDFLKRKLDQVCWRCW